MYQADMIYKKVVDYKKVKYGKVLHNYLENCNTITRKDMILINLRNYDSLGYYKYINSKMFISKSFIINLKIADYNEEESILIN